MTDEPNTEKKEEHSKIEPAPAGETKHIEPPLPPIVNATLKEDVTGKLGTENSKDKCDKSKEILVKVLEDDELKPFEVQTLFWAKVGFYLASATVVIAVLTLAIFYRQLNVMQTQLQDAETDSRISDLRAIQQRQTAQTQIDVITQQMRQDQRAWISYEIVSIGVPHGIPIVGKPFLIRVAFKNIGKSAAINVRNCTEENFLSKEEMPNFKCSGRNVSAGTMFPDSGTFVDLEVTTNAQQSDIDKIISNRWNMWVFGRVEYSDIFKTQHWFNFCTRLLPGGAYLVCDHHTEIDNN